MSIRVAVAAPFKQAGSDRLGENEFVVALSLDRDWMTPDQAKRVVDIAAGEGLIERDGEELVPCFDPGSVAVPDGFEPDSSLFRKRSAFERILDQLVEHGIDKQTAVAEVNELQDSLDVSLEAAAVLFARRHDVEIGDAADQAFDNLCESSQPDQGLTVDG